MTLDDLARAEENIDTWEPCGEYPCLPTTMARVAQRIDSLAAASAPLDAVRQLNTVINTLLSDNRRLGDDNRRLRTALDQAQVRLRYAQDAENAYNRERIAESCNRWRQKRKALAALETMTSCDRCGIQFDCDEEIGGAR